MVHEILLYHRAVIFIHKASSKLRKTWLEQIFDQTNPNIKPEDKVSRDVLYKSQLVDLNGVVAFFYKRPGYDLAQLNRLTSTIKAVLAMATHGGGNDSSTILAQIIKTHSTFTSAAPS